MDTAPDQPAEETWADIPEEIMSLSTDEILTRIRLIDNDLKVRSMSLAAALLSESIHLGDALRDITAATRTERHEGKDP